MFFSYLQYFLLWDPATQTQTTDRQVGHSPAPLHVHQNSHHNTEMILQAQHQVSQLHRGVLTDEDWVTTFSKQPTLCTRGKKCFLGFKSPTISIAGFRGQDVRSRDSSRGERCWFQNANVSPSASAVDHASFLSQRSRRGRPGLGTDGGEMKASQVQVGKYWFLTAVQHDCNQVIFRGGWSQLTTYWRFRYKILVGLNMTLKLKFEFKNKARRQPFFLIKMVLVDTSVTTGQMPNGQKTKFQF